MEEDDYPALYKAANDASKKSQDRHLGLVRSYSYAVIVAAGLGVYGIEDVVSAVGAALLIVGAIFISFMMILKKDEDVWYRARAVAESVKTSAWRFMMRGDPYNDAESVEVVKANLRQRMGRILREHKDLSHELGGDVSEGEQITQFMCDVRSKDLPDRVEFYRNHRIDEQRTWYAKKSGYNKRQSQVWFSILIACQAIAVTLVILRVAQPEWGYWPTEVFVVAAGSALTWIQVKRFRELSSAYGLTAHEIGIIRGELDRVEDEESFSQFVIDSESAFSREHTQWLARKDVV